MKRSINSQSKIEEIEAEKERKRQEALRIAEEKIRKNKMIVIVCIIIIVIVIIGIIAVINIYKFNMYKSAVNAFELGYYEEAYKKFSDLKGYKDTEEYIAKQEMIKFISVGDVTKFGAYTWYVIDKTDNGCTLLSENKVAIMPYNEERKNITWNGCTLRSWLNNDFYNKFSDTEKSLIVKTHNSTSDNIKHGTKGGSDTDDYIFLLSIGEANTLDEDIRNIGTTWWLRSSGDLQYKAAEVYAYRDESSFISIAGCYVDDKQGIRPALRISFEGE